MEAALEGKVTVSDTADSTDMEGLHPLPEELADVGVQLYLPFDFHPVAGLRSDLSGPQPPAKPGNGHVYPMRHRFSMSSTRTSGAGGREYVLYNAILVQGPRPPRWARRTRPGHAPCPACVT